MASQRLAPHYALLALVALIAASLTLLGGAQPARALSSTISLSASTYAANEGTAVGIIVNRTGDVTEAASVTLTLSGGTGVAGGACPANPQSIIDYIYVGPITVTFAASDPTETAFIPTCASAAGTSKTFNATLSNPSGDDLLGAQTSAAVTITDVPPASFQFSAATYSVTEGIPLTVTVTRTGGGVNANVEISFGGGTAVLNTDFSYSGSPGNPQLVFGTGTTSQTFQINALAPAGAQGPRTLNATIVQITPAGPLIGTPNPAVITINDAGGAGVPTVTNVNPASGPAGGTNTVIITGTNFLTVTGAAGVQFGPNNATSYVVNNASQITAVAPAGTGTNLQVMVTNPSGSSADTSADNYSYSAGPVITSLSPNTGVGGTVVTISGSGLSPSPTVTFGGIAATVNSILATSLNVTAPSGTGVVDVVVTVGGNQSPNTPNDDFTYTGTATITSVVPASGPLAGGQTVTINGTNLSNATSATFDGLAGTGLVVNGGGTSLTVVTPAHAAGAVNVVVNTPAGIATKTAGYTYTGGPTVTLLTPNNGGVGGGTSVTITGTGFSATATVSFGGTSALAVTFNSATSLTASSPSHALGVVDVIVTVSGVPSPNTPDDDFTYNGNLPVVNSVSPNGGPLAGGTVVTLTGVNFIGVAGTTLTVAFGALAGGNVVIVSTTQITVTAPAHAAGVVAVRVTTTAGVSADTSSDDYTYSDGPTITSLNNGTATPTQSPAGETKLVTITGTNFGTNAAPLITTVKFGNSSATFSVTNSTQIIAATPTNVPAGIVDVTVMGPGGTSPTSAATKYEFTGAGGPLPTVTALAPNTAPINTTPQVVITGTNFVAPLTASFGGVAATAIVINNATQITVTAPSRANAGVVDVVVTTNAGASSATGTGNDFTYTGAGGTVTYQLFFRWTLIVWTGKTNVDALTLLRGLENPDNTSTNDVSAQVTAIYRWSPNGSGCRDGAAQCWLGFFPSGVGVPGANDFNTLDNGQAYWFAIAGPGNLNWTTLTGP